MTDTGWVGSGMRKITSRGKYLILFSFENFFRKPN